MARRAQCTSNSKQMTLGLEMFANQHDQMFPTQVSMQGVGEATNLLNDLTLAIADINSPLVATNNMNWLHVGVGAANNATNASAIFFNRLYSQGGINNSAGGRGLVSDAKVFQCPSSGTAFTAPTGTSQFWQGWYSTAPLYGANLKIYGSSLPNAISFGDLVRTRSESGVGDATFSTNAATGLESRKGRNHSGEGFNFAFRDGHVKWYKGVSGNALVPLFITDSSDGISGTSHANGVLQEAWSATSEFCQEDVVVF